MRCHTADICWAQRNCWTTATFCSWGKTVWAKNIRNKIFCHCLLVTLFQPHWQNWTHPIKPTATCKHELGKTRVCESFRLGVCYSTTWEVHGAGCAQCVSFSTHHKDPVPIFGGFISHDYHVKEHWWHWEHLVRGIRPIKMRSWGLTQISGRDFLLLLRGNIRGESLCSDRETGCGENCFLHLLLLC